MIQLTTYNSDNQGFYLNLYDEMIVNGSETSMNPLISFTSQLTGKIKNFLALVTVYTHKERWVLMLLNVNATESPSSGQIVLGTTDFPYGMYDMKIYQNDPSTATNIDPANAIKLLYTGLMNLTPKAGNEAIDYKEYTTNDSETESVYITF
tara:strand:+ start:47 stop:499 length:453 start_codon:yes stop_codon:yes gene_type:complete